MGKHAVLMKLFHFAKRHTASSNALLLFDGITSRKLNSHHCPIYCRRLSNHWVHDGYEKDIRQAFLKICAKAKCNTFYDVGANVGIFSLDFITHFQSARVVAFEPNPSVFECLEMTKTKNNLHSLQVSNLALSNYEGVATLTFDPLSPAKGGLNPIENGKYNHELQYNGVSKQVGIKTSTLDAFALKMNLPPDVIKIDAEGEEFAILQGAKTVCETYKPILLLECSKDKEKMASLLNQYGYEIYNLHLTKTYLSEGMNFAIHRQKLNH